MNSFVVIRICIVLLHIICFLLNLTTAVGLGNSSCRYSGNFDPEGIICDKCVLNIEDLPTSCTSFVFDGVVCTQNNSIVNRWLPEDSIHLKSLIEFDAGSKSVFLFYKHLTIDDWDKTLFEGDFLAEAQAVQNFLCNYSVAGLILDGIDGIDLSSSSNFYQNFTTYVTTIKTKNPYLQIGLYLSAKDFISGVINSKVDSSYFDFCKLNDVLDFYLFEFATFNNCGDDFLTSGITPLESSDPEVNSLNKFGAAFEDSYIAKEKVYFEFLISPQNKPDILFNHCELSYYEYCKHNDSKPYLCIDNQNSLLEKGIFAKKYSQGFIARDVDLVDRHNQCECGDKYMTFTLLLNGYNGIEDLICCDVLSGEKK